MTRRLGCRFQHIAVAIAACGPMPGLAHADLGWFGRDDPIRPSQPIRMSEVVAWSDACLDIDEGKWDEIIGIHRDYLDSWQRDSNSTARDQVADQRFFQGLVAALGENHADCIEAMRAWRAVPTRLANDPESAAKLRREILALAGAPGTDAAAVAPGSDPDANRESRLAAQRLATELCQCMTTAVARGNTRARDELALLVRAVLPLRPRLIEVMGKDRADRLQRGVLLRADIVRPALLGPRTRTMLALADRLSPEERAAVAAVYARADEMLDQHLLEGVGLPGPAKEDDAPETRSAFERAWLATRLRAERSVAEGLKDVLGAERVSALRVLELDGVSPLGGSENGNAAADAALARFVDPARFDELAQALGSNPGDRPWHPMQVIALGEGELASMGAPTPVPRELLEASLEPAKLDDPSRAVIESLHAGHVARVAGLRERNDSHLGVFDALAKEDDRLFAEWTAAFGPDRVDAERLALVRLARAETGSPRNLSGTIVDNTWVQAPLTASGSVAMLALGVGQAAVLPLDEADRARLRAALVPLASDWKRQIDAETRGAIADASQDQAENQVLVRIGRDAARTRAKLERGQRLIESVQMEAGDATVARGVLLAMVEPMFDAMESSQRLEPLLTEASEIPEPIRARVSRRLRSAFIGSNGGALERLRRTIADCRAIERLTTRFDDADARSRARDASLRSIAASFAASSRREAAVADAWRALRDEGVSAAKHAFRP